jgi:hypothetical protein
MDRNRPARSRIELIIRVILACSTTLGFMLLSPNSGSSASIGMQESQPVKQFPEAVGGQIAYLPLVSKRFPDVSIFGIWNNSSSGTVFDRTVGARIKWMEGSAIQWSDVEPNEGDRNWGAISSREQLIANAASNSLNIVVGVRSTPLWAQLYPGVYCGPVKQDKLDEFADFMHDLVARYSQAPYNVKYWEIWNEPDVDRDLVFPNETRGCWGEDGDTYYGGEYFGDMLQAIYPAMKSADPNAIVLVGGLLLNCDPAKGPQCSPSNFLEGILVSGAGSSLDGVSFHAYDFYNNSLGAYGNANWSSFWGSTGPLLITKANFLQGVLSSYGFPNKLLMNNETAILCPSEVPGYDCGTDFETTKAYYIVQSSAASLANNLVASIWYSIYFDGFPNRFSGLLDINNDPLPAYISFKQTAEILSGYAFSREITEYANIMGYEFIRSDRTIWVLWSQDTGIHALTLPGVPDYAFQVDPSGNIIQIVASNPLNVSIAPVFLEWP